LTITQRRVYNRQKREEERMADFDYKKAMAQRKKHNYNEDVAIDLDNLHEEWRTHAQTRKDYADEVSYMEKVVKQAHEHVKVTRSRLIKLAKQDKTLTSDALRETFYRTHPDHVEAKDDHIDAEYELGMAWNVLKSFDDRKFALENHVKLWSRNYFATPREGREIEPGKRVMDQAKDEVVTKSRTEVNARRRRRNTS